MAKEVKSNFGSDGVKTVKPSDSSGGVRTAGSGSTCDGGFPEKIKAGGGGKGAEEEEETSNSSGVQSNSNYSDEFSDEGGGGGVYTGERGAVEANLVEHVTGNGCTLTAPGQPTRPGGGSTYRLAKLATSPHEASLLEPRAGHLNPQSGTQTPMGRYGKRVELSDPYGPMAYFPPPPSHGGSHV